MPEIWGNAPRESQRDQLVGSSFGRVHNARTAAWFMFLRDRSVGLYFTAHTGQSQRCGAFSGFDLRFFGHDGLLFLSRNDSLESVCRLRFDYLWRPVGNLAEMITILSLKTEFLGMSFLIMARTRRHGE